MPGVQCTGKGASLSSIPEFDDKQLAAARAKAWYQDGNPLLTAESALAWLSNFGLVLFLPRSLQLPSPAPSLVEATLGAPNAAPTNAEAQTARGFVGRLVADGTALPLNLIGVAGDTPDFVVSAQVFPYIFTLRGDKAWKQPPSTSGPVKVSPLGLKAFEVLTEHRSLTALQLASEMGREVTEAATLRVLTELWSQLRVIPVPQVGDQPVLWELTTRRFTKAIKSGANAGQPKALSALISLYLAQVTAATEEEVTTFLSPLTARSRLREVLHALTGARQLETTAVEGKTLLHLPGALMDYSAAAAAEGLVEGDPVAVVEIPKKIGTGRIRSFAGDRAASGEFRGEPARNFATGAKPARGGNKVPARFVARADGKSDRERRPFKKPGGPGASTKARFTKPWDEDRKKRPAAPARTDSFTKFRRSAPEDREPLGPREQAGLPPERRTYPKASFDRGSKPGGFVKRSFTPRSGEGTEPGSFKPRSLEQGANRSAKPGGFSAKRPYSPRPSGGEDRGSFKPRSFDSSAKPRGFSAKGPYTPRPAEGGERTLPKRPYKPRAADADQRVYTKAPWVPKTERAEGGSAKRPFKQRASSGAFDRTGAAPRKSYAARPAGKFGAKPGGKFGAKFGDAKSGFPRSGEKKFGPKTSGKPAFRSGAGSKRSSSAPGARTTDRKKPKAEEAA
jgi:hypothetical protein